MSLQNSGAILSAMRLLIFNHYSMKPAWLVVLLTVVIGWSGCTSTYTNKPSIYRKVMAYSSISYDDSPKTYLLVPKPGTGLSIGDVMFDQYAAPIHAALEAAGFRRYTGELKADLLIVFTADSDTVSIKSLRHAAIYTPGTTQTSTVLVPTSQGLQSATIRSSSPGSTSYVPRDHTIFFNRARLILEAHKWPIEGDDAPRIWICAGSLVSEELPAGGPEVTQLIARMIPSHIGRNSGTLESVDENGQLPTTTH